jgi:hypothetical protein
MIGASPLKDKKIPSPRREREFAIPTTRNIKRLKKNK